MDCDICILLFNQTLLVVMRDDVMCAKEYIQNPQVF